MVLLRWVAAAAAFLDPPGSLCLAPVPGLAFGLSFLFALFLLDGLYPSPVAGLRLAVALWVRLGSLLARLIPRDPAFGPFVLPAALRPCRLPSCAWALAGVSLAALASPAPCVFPFLGASPGPVARVATLTFFGGPALWPFPGCPLGSLSQTDLDSADDRHRRCCRRSPCRTAFAAVLRRAWHRVPPAPAASASRGPSFRPPPRTWAWACSSWPTSSRRSLFSSRARAASLLRASCSRRARSSASRWALRCSFQRASLSARSWRSFFPFCPSFLSSPSFPSLLAWS